MDSAVVVFKLIHGGKLSSELFRSAAYTLLIAFLIIAFILISGEDFHEHFGIVMRVALLPIGLISVLFGRGDLSWPAFLVIEFVFLFVVVIVTRFVCHLATANRG